MMNEIYLKAIEEQGTRDAIDLRKRAPKMSETEIIDEEEKVPDFNPQKQYLNYPAKTPTADEGQIWILIQPYDSITYPQKPSEMRTQWGLAHTKNRTKAKPFVPSFGRSGEYYRDECCTVPGRPGKGYQCNVETTTYSPVDYPAAWIEYDMEE